MALVQLHFRAVAVAVLLAATPATALEPAEAASLARRATVQVSTKDSLASGFAVHPRIVVTNAHVVGSADAVTVTQIAEDSRKAVVCTVRRRDIDWDLAILLCPTEVAHPLSLSTTSARVGVRVLTVGNPAGLQGITTFGRVSKTSGPFIFTDAAINPGNSGGPLVGMDGRALGIVTLKGRNLEGIGIAQSVALLPMLWRGDDYVAEMVASAQTEARFGQFTPVAASRYTRVKPSWAAEVCGFDANDHFSCLEAELTRAEMLVLQSKTTHEQLTTAFDAIVDPAWECIRGVRLALAHPTEQLKVDWAQASFAVNGIAAQAAPAFSGDAVKSLAQRPSVAAPGVSLVQDVVSLDRQCLLEASATSPTDTVRLILPVQIGTAGGSTLVEWNLFREWRRANPAEVASSIGPPDVLPDKPWPVAPSKPDVTHPDDVERQPYALLLGVAAAGTFGVGALLGVGSIGVAAIFGAAALGALFGCGVGGVAFLASMALVAIGFYLTTYEEERVSKLARDYEVVMSYYEKDMQDHALSRYNRQEYEAQRLRSLERRKSYDDYIARNREAPQAY